MTLVINAKLEVQFVPGGVFIDISNRLVSASIDRPRGTVETPWSPTVLTAALDNSPATAAEITSWGVTTGTGYTPFTPDNQAAAFSPNIERDRMIKLTAVWSGGSSLRFYGWVDEWEPDASDGVAQASVTITASDIAARYARRDLISDYGELVSNQTNSDYWPFDDDPNSTRLRGLSSDRPAIPAGQVVPAAAGTGSLALEKPDAGVLMDGAITLSRGDGTVTNSPVVLLKLRVGSGIQVSRVSMWVKLNGDFTGTADDVCAAYDFYGALIWRLQAALSGGAVQWRILDENQAGRTVYTTSYPRDNSWHWLSVIFFDNAGDPGSGLAIRDQTIPDAIVAGYSSPWPRDPSKNNYYLVVGGNMSPRQAGKQANTLNGSISGVWVTYGAAAGSSYSYLSAAGNPITGLDRSNLLMGYGATMDALVGGGAGGSDPDPTPVQITNATDNLLDAWNEHIRTIGGRIFTRTDGKRQVRVPSAATPITVVATLDVDGDIDAPQGGWVGERRTRPTRQTVTSPSGSVTVIDSATETLTGLRLTGSDISSAAGDEATARSLAYQQIIGSKSRMQAFGVDATTMATVTVATLMAVQPWDRIRLNGVPSAYLGLTYMDVYASGWKETYIHEAQSCGFIFDTDPADDPPTGIFNNTTYGRFALGSGASTVTGGTCVGNTGTGTIVNTGNVLTSSAGDYPMDLNWNGERVTASGVGGATSPQTITITARGVAPTVARVHATGESLELWMPLTFGV
jgi:hypothetical protein